MFNIEISIIVLLITVLGGIGNIWVLNGAAILIPISEYSKFILGHRRRSRSNFLWIDINVYLH